MALETPTKPEGITEDRVRSIFYSSFDISQGDIDLQGLLLARLFASHPDIAKRFADISLENDPVILKQLQARVSSHAGLKHIDNKQVQAQPEKVLGRAKVNLSLKGADKLSSDETLIEIAENMMHRDYMHISGRKRIQNAQEIKVFKQYVIEHAVLNEPYKGDLVWRELFSEIGRALNAYALSEHGGKFGTSDETFLRAYFSEYNNVVQNHTYTNKNCKEIDIDKLNLFK